jgi:hypothetical protein
LVEQVMSEPQIDWRSIEDKLLRRAAKAKSFRELYGDAYGGGSAKRVPVRSITGRMSVAPPPYHLVSLRELGTEAQPISEN